MKLLNNCKICKGKLTGSKEVEYCEMCMFAIAEGRRQEQEHILKIIDRWNEGKLHLERLYKEIEK